MEPWTILRGLINGETLYKERHKSANLLFATSRVPWRFLVDELGLIHDITVFLNKLLGAATVETLTIEVAVIFALAFQSYPVFSAVAAHSFLTIQG